MKIQTLLELYLYRYKGDSSLIKEETCFGKYLFQCDLKSHFKHSQDVLGLNDENSGVASAVVETAPQKSQRGRKNDSGKNKGKRRAESTLSIEKKLPKKHLHGEKENPICLSEASNSDSDQQLPVKKNKKSNHKAVAKTKGPIKHQKTPNKIRNMTIKESQVTIRSLRSQDRSKNHENVHIPQQEEFKELSAHQIRKVSQEINQKEQKEKSFILNLFSDSPIVIVHDADLTNKIFEGIRSNLMMAKMLEPFDCLVMSSDEDEDN